MSTQYTGFFNLFLTDRFCFIDTQLNTTEPFSDFLEQPNPINRQFFPLVFGIHCWKQANRLGGYSYSFDVPFGNPPGSRLEQLM